MSELQVTRFHVIKAINILETAMHDGLFKEYYEYYSRLLERVRIYVYAWKYQAYYDIIDLLYARLQVDVKEA